jgi:hypothetical protein
MTYNFDQCVSRGFELGRRWRGSFGGEFQVAPQQPGIAICFVLRGNRAATPSCRAAPWQGWRVKLTSRCRRQRCKSDADNALQAVRESSEQSVQVGTCVGPCSCRMARRFFWAAGCRVLEPRRWTGPTRRTMLTVCWAVIPLWMENRSLQQREAHNPFEDA